MGSKDTERQVIGTTYFQGELVTIMGRGRILGKEYYEIRFQNGNTRTVPADACSAINENANKNNR